MKLNNKGYLLVEIIVASVLAMTIAYFLIDLTLNLKEKNDDVFVDTILITDKVLITDQIMRDINNYKLTKINQNVETPNIVDLTFTNFTKRITITNNNDQYIFQYGLIDETNNYNSNAYYKEFNSSLDVRNPIITTSCYQDNNFISCNSNHDKGLLKINIDAYTLYSDTNYGITIEIPYNTKELTVETISPPDIFTPTISNITETSFTINAKANSKAPIKEYEYYVDNELKCKTSNEMCNVINLQAGQTYTIYVKATNEFNLSTNSNQVTATTIKKPNYLYYTTSDEGSYNMYFYRCNTDSSSCQRLSTLKGFANSVGGSFGPKIIASENYLYYTTSDEGSYNMYFYRCNSDGSSCQRLSNLKGFANYLGGSFGPEIVANNNYLYYTTSDDGSYNMDLYRCNADGSSCQRIKSLKGFANGVGGSYGPTLILNNDYLYYTTSDDGSYNMDLYRCNADGSSCQRITSLKCFANSLGGAYGPQIKLSNNYLYYTTSNDGSYNMELYRCNTDGSSCQRITSLKGFANSLGGDFGPEIALSNNYLYYTASDDGSYNMYLYRCNADGSSCQRLSNLKGFANYVGGAFGPKIHLSEDYLYYTTSDEGSYNMYFYRCNTDGSSCQRLSTLKGFANYLGGSFGPEFTTNY